MTENEFAKFLMSKLGAIRADPKKALGKTAGGFVEPLSWYYNRAPDQADMLSRPGIRNKINAGVGTALAEGVNWAKDTASDMLVDLMGVAGAPESGGTSLGLLAPRAVNPAKAILNFAGDYLLDEYVNPMLYDIADNDINLGGRLPKAPSWYKGSPVQKAVNAADKKVTDIASFVSRTHPQNIMLNKAGETGGSHGAIASKIKQQIFPSRK
jgi:hypothetical protein